MADWLAAEGFTNVARECTGVFWKPIFNILESRFAVLLVNARHLKQVPGRKSDVRDCHWIAQLLQCGLLKGSFIPRRRSARCETSGGTGRNWWKKRRAPSIGFKSPGRCQHQAGLSGHRCDGLFQSGHDSSVDRRGDQSVLAIWLNGSCAGRFPSCRKLWKVS